MNLKSPPKIQRILENHIASILAQQPRWQQSGQMWHLLTRLVEGEPLAFTVAAIEQHLAASIANRTHRDQGGFVSDMYLTVSTVPAVDAADIRRFFPGGYGVFVTDLLHASGYASGDVHVAHWTFGSDGHRHCAHLTLFPSAALMKPHRHEVGLVLACDLYTEGELNEPWVTATNIDTQEKVRVKADVAGYYRFSDLASGTYRLVCIKQGYKLAVRKVEAPPNETTFVDFVLEPR